MFNKKPTKSPNKSSSSKAVRVKHPDSYYDTAPFSEFDADRLLKFFIKDFIETVTKSPEWPPKLNPLMRDHIPYDPNRIPSTQNTLFFNMTQRRNRPMISRGKQNWTVNYKQFATQTYRGTTRVIDLNKLDYNVSDTSYDYMPLRRIFESLTIDAWISHYFDHSYFLKAYKTNKAGSGRYATIYECHISLDTFIDAVHEAKMEFTEDVVYFLMKRVLVLLEFIHETVNIVHNDINAGSVFITEPGFILLGDFIYATPMSDLNGHKQKVDCGFSQYHTDVMGLMDILTRMVAPDMYKKLRTIQKPIRNIKVDSEDYLAHMTNLKTCILETHGSRHDYSELADILCDDRHISKLANELLTGVFNDNKKFHKGHKEFQELLDAVELRPKPFLSGTDVSSRLTAHLKLNPVVGNNIDDDPEDPIGSERIATFRRYRDSKIHININYRLPAGDPYIEVNGFSKEEVERYAKQEPEVVIIAEALRGESQLLHDTLAYANQTIGDHRNQIDAYPRFPWHALVIRNKLYEFFIQYSVGHRHIQDGWAVLTLNEKRNYRIVVRFFDLIRQGKTVEDWMWRISLLDRETPKEHIFQAGFGGRKI